MAPLVQETAMNSVFPDVDALVFVITTTVCSLLMLAL